MDHLYDRLCEICGNDYVSRNEDMSRHVTFRAGGKAAYFVVPQTTEALKKVLAFVKNEKQNYYVMGNGSNLLVRDEGFDGVIIKIGNAFGTIEADQENQTIYCQAGAMLSKVAAAALDHGLTGLEFAAGIPGMIGGAIAMNAGAYGGEMKDIVQKVWVIDEENQEICLEGKQMLFGYRTSLIQKKSFFVTAVLFQLASGNQETIREKMNELLAARKEKQPLEYPSAGSTFKRPEGYFAGKLIMEAGLKGFRIGDAQVSEKHCGFVINRGNATAGEIIRLMDHVEQKVYETFGVKLEPEVRII